MKQIEKGYLIQKRGSLEENKKHKLIAFVSPVLNARFMPLVDSGHQECTRGPSQHGTETASYAGNR